MPVKLVLPLLAGSITVTASSGRAPAKKLRRTIASPGPDPKDLDLPYRLHRMLVSNYSDQDLLAGLAVRRGGSRVQGLHGDRPAGCRRCGYTCRYGLEVLLWPTGTDTRYRLPLAGRRRQPCQYPCNLAWGCMDVHHLKFPRARQLRGLYRGFAEPSLPDLDRWAWILSRRVLP